MLIPKITLVFLDWLQFLRYRRLKVSTFFGNFFFEVYCKITVSA